LEVIAEVKTGNKFLAKVLEKTRSFIFCHKERAASAKTKTEPLNGTPWHVNDRLGAEM
jgi:hypothetical protein